MTPEEEQELRDHARALREVDDLIRQARRDKRNEKRDRERAYHEPDPTIPEGACGTILKSGEMCGHHPAYHSKYDDAGHLHFAKGHCDFCACTRYGGQAPVLPEPGERLVFGLHRIAGPDAQTAEAWPTAAEFEAQRRRNA